MSYNDLSRPLDISDVDFRVQSINNGGYATILAYKDARVDMNRLDQCLTPYGWQRDYKMIDGKLFCGVGIWNKEAGQWIWKWDVGTESFSDAEKGHASDAFKRACFNLGIGRELYDYPVISVKLKDNEWSKETGKPKQTYNLKIKEWKWYSEFTDGKISFLAAKDEQGAVRFKWGVMKPKDKGEEPNYKPASGGEPSGEAHAPEAPKEEGNPAGVLKKQHDPIVKEPVVDEVRESLVAEYTSLFGKAPHGKKSNDTIAKEIKDHLESLEKETEEEEEMEMAKVPTIDMSSEEDEEEEVAEMPQPVEDDEEEEEEEIVYDSVPEDSLLAQFDKISSFTNRVEFIEWAKTQVAKYIELTNAEDVDRFKDLCNNHYVNTK